MDSGSGVWTNILFSGYEGSILTYLNNLCCLFCMTWCSIDCFYCQAMLVCIAGLKKNYYNNNKKSDSERERLCAPGPVGI